MIVITDIVMSNDLITTKTLLHMSIPLALEVEAIPHGTMEIRTRIRTKIRLHPTALGNKRLETPPDLLGSLRGQIFTLRKDRQALQRLLPATPQRGPREVPANRPLPPHPLPVQVEAVAGSAAMLARLMDRLKRV